MSRIGRKPIIVPEGTKVTIHDREILVSGPKGELKLQLPDCLNVMTRNRHIKIESSRNDRQCRAKHGLFRSLINNAVCGVSQGFEKKLIIKGIGYRAAIQGEKLILALGYSHPVEFVLPKGIEINIEKNNIITVSGFDKQQVGQVAAEIRSFRPPEPYKGKGIMYADEKIIRKPGKAVKTATTS